jgi:hypothetical protein
MGSLRHNAVEGLEVTVEHLFAQGKSGLEVARALGLEDEVELWYRLGMQKVSLTPPRRWAHAYNLGRRMPSPPRPTAGRARQRCRQPARAG